MVGRRSKTSRLRRDAEAIRDDVQELRNDARDAIEETLSHPVVDRVIDAIRERPVTAVAITAALMFVGARLTQRRHWEE